jgi:helix-turn-helix protein
MTQDDVLFGYRLQLFDLAARTTVTHACRTFGVHRSTYYRWKAQVDRQGLEMLRPRERRHPQMPNQIPQIVEERIVAFSLGHPGLGPRGSRRCSPGRSGARCVSRPTACGRCASPRDLDARQAAVVDRRLPRPYEPPRGPEPEPHVDSDRPGELVGSTASSSAAWRTPRARSGRSRRSTPTQATPGSTSSAPRRPARRPSTRSAGPARRPRARPSRLAAGTRADRQRQRVPRRALQPRDHRARRPPDPDPRRTPADQRTRRTPPPHDPRRVLATGVRAISLPRLHRPAPPPGQLHHRLQQPPRPHRKNNGRKNPGRSHLRCPQNGAPTSRTCRHNSEAVQISRCSTRAVQVPLEDVVGDLLGEGVTQA